MGTWYDERLEAQARAYERSQSLLFVARFVLLFALAAVFWTSGWSRALADGLRRGMAFPFSWALIHAAFVALAVFGYEAVLFPLSVLADFSLERAHGRTEVEFGVWLRGYLVTLLLEIGLVTGGFAGWYALMRFFPSVWWLLSAGIYALLVVGLGEWGPSQLLPKVRKPVPSSDPLLEADLRRVGREAGLEIDGADWWDFEHQEDLEDVRLTGRGRHRRAVYSEWAWRKLGRREQVFAAARHMAWIRSGAAWTIPLLQTVLAAGVFLGAALLADGAARARGLSGVTAPETFPFLVMALFGCAALAGVVAHAAVRFMELRADRFALRHAGGAEVLRSCLRQEFQHEPYAVDAPAWQVWLLRRRPTARRRLAQAEARGAAGSPAE
jgi:STE24 endopeptidase